MFSSCGRNGLLLTNCMRRCYTTGSSDVSKHFSLLVLGGGSGGCSVAARACRALGQGKVAVVEPAKFHYYQPMWTLVGAGVKDLNQSEKKMEDVLPKQCHRYTECVTEFDPDNNTVTLSNGDKIGYDYLVVGVGIQINLNKVDGLIEALKADPMVCSNYKVETVQKTYPALQSFKGGNAIFTFPNTPIKCAGAPQKIMYLADEFWRKHGVRDKTDILYNTSLPVIFGVKKYAASLMEVVKEKNINVNYRRNLVAVDHNKKTAKFELLDSKDGETEEYKYDFLHVAPPMSAPDVLKNSTSPIVCPTTGFLDVNKTTLQHNKYKNIFGIGDCTNVPTAKTAAAVAAQNKILLQSLEAVWANKDPKEQYDGYTSCPLITGYSSCILAEFDFDGQPLETFPIDQGKRMRTMYHLKKDVMPEIYWTMLLGGRWGGPKPYRKMMHLGMSR